MTEMRMQIGRDSPTVIELKRRPTPQERNVLHILGEYPNRLVTWSDLCERLGVTRSTAVIHVCRLRKCLTSDWLVQQSQGEGYRLIDLRDK